MSLAGGGGGGGGTSRSTRNTMREVRILHLQLRSLDRHGAAVAIAPRCLKRGVRDGHVRETLRHDRTCGVQRESKSIAQFA